MASASSTRFPRLTRYGAQVAVVLALGMLFLGSTGEAAIEAAQMGGQIQLLEGTLDPATPIDIEFLAEPQIPTPLQQQMMQYTETNRHETPPLPAGPAVTQQFELGPELILPGAQSAGAAVAPPSPATVPNAHRGFVNSLYKGPTGYNSDVGEPSLDANENVFFISHNWYAATSSDYGKNWSYVNPFTIANVDGGFCCDQKVIFAPDHDMVIWLIQTIKDSVDNRYRIVVFRGLSDASTATYYYFDLFPSQMGLTGEWFDFPDVQVGNTFYYIHFNRFSLAGSYTGSSFVRMPLADMADAGGTTFQYTNSLGTASNRFAAGSTDTIYMLGHLNTSTVRIFELAESSNTPATTDVPLSLTWSNPVACPGIGGVNPCSRIQGGWNARPTAAFIGGLNRNEIVMMWTMGPNGPATRNHVMSARFALAAPHALQGMHAIWSNAVDITYPSAAPNARGAVGGTYLGFFPTQHPVCYTWITDDVTPSLNNPAVMIAATSSATEPASGDYLETRGYGNVWLGACFSYSGGFQNSTDYRALMFGRSRDAPAFVKGMTADGLLLPPSTLVSKLADAESR